MIGNSAMLPTVLLRIPSLHHSGMVLSLQPPLSRASLTAGRRDVPTYHYKQNGNGELMQWHSYMVINLVILAEVSWSSWDHVHMNMFHCLSRITAILYIHAVCALSRCVECMCVLSRILLPSPTCTAMVRLVALNSLWMTGAILCVQRNKSDTSSGVRSANRATTRLVETSMSSHMLRTTLAAVKS